MARPKNTFGRSDETYEVLRDHVGPISREYPCDGSHIYAIKNGDKNDPYPPFRHMFKSAVYAGAPYEIYLRDLNGIVGNRHSDVSTITELVRRLPEKIEADSHSTSELLKGIGDNHLDRNECRKTLDALDTNDKINQGIRRIVEARLASLNDGLKAVRS
ncbi:hypothetical protein BH10ACI2_BH10ACI2_00190 [soil metagenome]